MIRIALTVIVFLHLFQDGLIAQIDARLFRYPDITGDRVAFVFAGDIWLSDKNGGHAVRLTSPKGEESFPRFSPDGTKIAFSGNYDGNTDIYVVSVSGGEPSRITFHPENDRILDWTPDGESLLFASNRESGIGRVSQFYRVSANGGMPEKLPLAYAESGGYSPDSRSLVFTTKERGSRTWKRYRGGMSPEIWILDMESKAARNLSNSDANDSSPMWIGDSIYFLSDRGPAQRSNIWVCKVDGSNLRQLTSFTDVDAKWPAAGPAEIVFQAGENLFSLNLDSEEYRALSIQVVTDRITVKPRLANVSRFIESAGISPTGKRAVFEARGDLFTVPAKHGVIRNLTRTSGAAERFPAWSPDGKTLAFWSDWSGEYELQLMIADGSGKSEEVTALGPGYRYRIFWAPDSKKLAFIDHSQMIWVFDVESKELKDVDKGLWMLHSDLARFELNWSPDSKWLVYSRGLATGNRAVFIYDVNNDVTVQVTSGYYNDSSPVFDPEGKYLFYLSNRSLRPLYSDLDPTWIYPNSTQIVAASLRSEVPSLLVPRSDEEDVGEETDEPGEDQEEGDNDDLASKEGSDESSGKEGAEADSPDNKVEVELEGLESRAVILPPAAGRYSSLRAVKGKLLFRRLPRTGSSGRTSPLIFYDFEKREESTVLSNVSAYELAIDGKSLLVSQNGRWAIVKVAPEQKIDEALPTSQLESFIDPKLEWQQIFNDVWRSYRDHFYDENMHGLDWVALRDFYQKLLDDSVTRWDVNFVIGELIGEVNASHTYVFGGDTERAPARGVGLLGIDWKIENGAFRIGRIVKGASWDIEVRSPLLEPGIDIEEGDYILAVNGLELDTSREPFSAFQGLAGKTVSLTVNDSPTLEGAKEILVATLQSERRLRNLEWIEQNRKKVEQASGGRVGYIFVPNTSISGQSELVRQFNSQMLKDGLIIDERFNAGGQLPDRFIELMNRKLVNRIAFRHGAVVNNPPVTHYGPKVMLINGWAGSGGDAFPYFFKTLKVGPIVGERTWGGLIGPAVGHSTIDGGRFTAPPGRIYGPNGEWFAEGHGVDPDIPVVDEPGEMARGRDPQLERAITEVLRLLETTPSGLPDPPAFEERIP